jgi:hypothetical protein
MGESERQTVEFNFYLTVIWEQYLFGEHSKTGATLLPSDPHRRRGFASRIPTAKCVPKVFILCSQAGQVALAVVGLRRISK